LSRAAVTILAEDGGSLEVEATVFVPDCWPEPNFIGYQGLLERCCFAVDPLRRLFYFGPVTDFT